MLYWNSVYLQQLVSMWRQCSTRTWSFRCGTSEVRRASGLTGAATTPIRTPSSTSSIAWTEIALAYRSKNWSLCWRYQAIAVSCVSRQVLTIVNIEKGKDAVVLRMELRRGADLPSQDHWVCDAWPLRCQTYGYLTSHAIFCQYQVILLCDRGTCLNNLSRVVHEAGNGTCDPLVARPMP